MVKWSNSLASTPRVLLKTLLSSKWDGKFQLYKTTLSIILQMFIDVAISDLGPVYITSNAQQIPHDGLQSRYKNCYDLRVTLQPARFAPSGSLTLSQPQMTCAKYENTRLMRT